MTWLPTVVVADAKGPAYEAVLKLAALAEQELVRPFWFVAAALPGDEPWTASYYDRWGETEVLLFASLGEQETGGVRVVAVATVGDRVEPVRVAEIAGSVADQLDALAPSEATVRTARIWFPAWDDLESPDPDFFSPHADANVVVVPEDRRSDHFVAAPVAGGGALAGHISAELATLTGMFAGMETTPLDGMRPGVIFGSSPKVRLARSFVRVAQSPAIPLQAVVEHEGQLPVPPGTVGAPSPDVAVSDLVERSAGFLSGLIFEVRPPEPIDRRQMGPGQTLLLVLKEMGSFVVSLPRRAVAGVLEDFSELAGRTMQDLVGDSSVVEVVWRGKLKPVGDREALDAQLEELKSQAERRLDLHGGPAIDQTVWRDIRSLVLAAVDGGDLPGGLEPVEVRGRRAVIDEAAAVSPRPADTLVETAAAILADAESNSPRTLLGRLGARVGGVAEANRRATARLLERLEEDVSGLAGYRPPSLALAHVLGSILLAALVVAVLLFSGVVRNVGVTEMGDLAKNSTFLALTGSSILLLNLFRSYARRAAAELAPGGAHSEPAAAPAIKRGATVAGAVIGVVGAALFLGVGVSRLGYPATDAATWAALVAGAVTGAGLGQAFTLGERQQELAPLGRMGRLSTLVVLGYVAVLLIGAVAQRNGWYANATDQQLDDLLWPVVWVLGSLLLTVLVYVSWRRVRERLTVHSYGVSIRQLADQVNDALVGDRVADAAKEQFLGLAAVLARVVWYPYGRSGAMPTDRLRIDGFGVTKAAFCQFGLSETGARLLEARTRSMAADRGWLTAQYERSVASYRQAAALVHGSGEAGSVDRPDEDPTTVAQHEVEARAAKADRWRWADDLFAGKYDAELMAALEAVGEEEVFRPILADGENFEPVRNRGPELTLAGFMAEVLPAGRTDVDPRYFDPDHLAGALFSREWRPAVWWPQEGLFSPGTSTVEPIEPFGSMARGRVWLAVRCDLTDDLQPAALWGDETPDEPEKPGPGPEY